MKVLLAHPGTQYSHQLAKQLQEQNVLYRFYTCIALPSNGFLANLSRFLPAKIYAKISNRIIDKIPSSKIFSFWLFELQAIKKLKRGENSEEVLFERNRLFQLAIPDNALMKADIIIGFDTSSWILAERCRKMGKKFILDVSIAHPRSKDKVYKDILGKFPEWSFSISNKNEHLIEVENKEMEIADGIVVASSFTKNSLIENGVNERKIYINPYGVDIQIFHPYYREKSDRRNITFLFTGLVDARKGVPLLLNAWRGIKNNNSMLTLVGPMEDQVKQIALDYENVKVIGKIPFKDLPSIMQQQDVFVFPSYFEGFGLVILEAMATGLPVITTSATCGPDIIENGNEGFIIESGNENELKEAMLYFMNNPMACKEMGIAARRKAEKYTWDTYGERWKNVLLNMI